MTAATTDPYIDEQPPTFLLDRFEKAELEYDGGNMALGLSDAHTAIVCYSKAIQVLEGVSSKDKAQYLTEDQNVELEEQISLYYAARSGAHREYKEPLLALDDAQVSLVRCRSSNMEMRMHGLWMKGMALSSLHRYEEAIAAFQEGQALFPDSPEFENGLQFAKQGEQQMSMLDLALLMANSGHADCK